MSTAKWQNIAGSKKFFNLDNILYISVQLALTRPGFNKSWRDKPAIEILNLLPGIDCSRILAMLNSGAYFFLTEHFTFVRRISIFMKAQSVAQPPPSHVRDGTWVLAQSLPKFIIYYH